jgi:predicted alpha/beta hydrolase
MAKEKITIRAEDGRELAARWWEGAAAAERSLVFLPGLAVPQDYLTFFASFLAKQGWGVLTFDYRSVGESRNGSSDQAVTLDEWAHLDLPAAVGEARRRANPRFLGVVAHSIGGQLLGQSSIRHEIDGALLIAAQRGIPSLYKGVGRLRVEYAYAVFPLLIRLLGRLPVSQYTLPTECSGQAVAQWVRWGRRKCFTNQAGENMEPRFADYRGLMTAITIADDDYYAPAAAVEALLGLYQNAERRIETIHPHEFGLEKIGHFGFFHRHVPRELWMRAESWLREMETNTRVTTGSTGNTGKKQ